MTIAVRHSAMSLTFIKPGRSARQAYHTDKAFIQHTNKSPRSKICLPVVIYCVWVAYLSELWNHRFMKICIHFIFSACVYYLAQQESTFALESVVAYSIF